MNYLIWLHNWYHDQPYLNMVHFDQNQSALHRSALDSISAVDLGQCLIFPQLLRYENEAVRIYWCIKIGAWKKPGRKGSMKTSDRSQRRFKIPMPSLRLRSIAIDRFPRIKRSMSNVPELIYECWNKTNLSRKRSRQIYLTLSTRITWAPKSAKIIPQNGAGAKPAISTTRIPFNAIIIHQGSSAFS